MAYGFIFLGLYQSFFLNDFGGGLWMAFIGWFLLSAAQESVTGTVVRETLRNITVGQLMDPAPHAAAPHMTVAQLLTQFILPGNQHMAPVAQDGRAVGIITLSDIKDVPQEDWGTVTVGDRMTHGEQLRMVRPQDNLTRAMELLGAGDFDQLLVVDADGAAGGPADAGAGAALAAYPRRTEAEAAGGGRHARAPGAAALTGRAQSQEGRRAMRRPSLRARLPPRRRC